MGTTTAAALDMARDVAALEDERDRFREHSLILNRVLWRLAVAIGDVDADDVTALDVDNVEEFLERVVARIE